MWLVLDYFCDGVYILDVVVRLHTGNDHDLTQILMTELKCFILHSFFDLLFPFSVHRILRARIDGERFEAPEACICTDIPV